MLPHLDQLVYEQILGGKRRILYTERAGVLLKDLALPAYRHAISRNRWPLVGALPRSEHVVEMLEDLGKISGAADLREEEQAVASLILKLLAYSEGRRLNLPSAFVRAHMENCKS